AKIRIISDAVDDLDLPDGDNLYNKRAASQWFNWIQSNTPTPSPSRLFSASNASFLVNTSGSTTPFSLPEMSLQKFSDHSTHTLTFGRAWSDHTDAAWDALKRAFVIGDASSG